MTMDSGVTDTGLGKSRQIGVEVSGQLLYPKPEEALILQASITLSAALKVRAWIGVGDASK